MSGRPTPFARRAAVLGALALGLALAAAAVRSAPAPADAPGEEMLTAASGRCGVCHPRDRVAFEKSPHATEGLHCTSCHGGNDQTDKASTAHSGASWRGRLTKPEIPKLCGSCHSNPKLMQPYDLPVDQYALYQTSVHGQRLAKGDTRVAVCSDCHGPHEILAPNDPASSVYVTNIPRTCGRCHGDSALVKAEGIRDTYHAYLTSVHAKQLFDAGNLSAPTCVSCHGVHGATPPEGGDVNKVCGRCHTAERRYFLAGPHASGMSRGGLAECSSCHGDHAIQASVTGNLAADCVECHDKNSAEAKLGDRLLADYRGASEEIEQASKWVDRADAVPIETDDFRARVQEARTYLREAMTAAHSVRPDIMGSFTVRARSTGAEVTEEIQKELGNIRTNKLALIVFWFYVLVTVGILRRFRNARPQGR